MLPGRGIVINSTNPTIAQNSSIITADHMVQISAQVVTTGASTGNVVLQASNDPPTLTPKNWTPVPLATVAVAGAESVMMPLTEVCYAWLRFVYTPTAGAAGTLIVQFKSNGF